MSEINQAQGNLLDFAALGSKLHELLKAEEQFAQLRRSQADVRALTAYQQEIAILSDQIKRIRNSLVHSPLEDAVKQITSVQGSTQEAVHRWDNLSKLIREISDVSEAVRRLAEATRAGADVNELTNISSAVNQANEFERMRKAVSEANEFEKIRKAVDEATELEKMRKAVDEANELKKLIDAAREIDQIKKLK